MYLLLGLVLQRFRFGNVALQGGTGRLVVFEHGLVRRALRAEGHDALPQDAYEKS